MIELVLRQADVAQVRFGYSPIQELVGSVMTLRDPKRRLMHAKFASWARPRLDEQAIGLLTALTPPDQYIPDFLAPVTGSGLASLDEELERVAATPAERVRAELDQMVAAGAAGRPLPEVARDLYEDPERYLPWLVEDMRRYWTLALQPLWDRVLGVDVDDVGFRMQQVATGGIASVLNSLNPIVSYRDDVIAVDKAYQCRHDLLGTGLLLMPCVFAWPTVMVVCCDADLPTLIYAARGIGRVWEDRAEAHTAALGALLGRTRATLLGALDLPATTTQLAARLNVTAAAVSQHLQVLKATALVTSRREGRSVLYQRTPTATALLDATADPA